jgi:small subunit ribosomal protein S6
MPQRIYECLILLDTTKVAGDQAGAVAQLHATLEKHHAKVQASRPWDERRLAYPINGQKKGLYFLIYFETEPKNVSPIEHDFKLNETILRFQTLRIEEKWVETMLALARDEHALALQSVQEDPLDATTGSEPVGAGHRGPRGRRGDDDDKH